MQAEVSATATIPAANVAAVLALLTERCGSAGIRQRLWERNFKSALPKEKRGLGEVRVLSDGQGELHELRTVAAERLAIAKMSKARPKPCLEARRVAKVSVSNGVQHFVAALGFVQAHEALRRGHFFRDGNVTVSVFELCRRQGKRDGSTDLQSSAGSDDQWMALGDGALWIVELRVSGAGEQLAQTVGVADLWVDVLSSVSDLVFEEVISIAAAQAAEAHKAAIARNLNANKTATGGPAQGLR